MRAYDHSGGKRRVQCVGRAERGECDEPTFFAHIIEDQIGELLRKFIIPMSDQGRLYTAWRRSQSRSVDVVAERLRLSQKGEHLKRLYVEGDRISITRSIAIRKPWSLLRLQRSPKIEGILTRQ
jgi:hypothetical protein